MAEKIFFCTVGGSHQPIIQAIADINPYFVYFFCTAGNAGSESQITGEGKIIKRHREDEKPSLPNIPAQAGLERDKYEVVNIRPDDLDSAYQQIVKTIECVRQSYEAPQMYADYTGGTKTMTAAVVLAALEYKIDLRLVTGKRADLYQVADGTEWTFPANVERIQMRRDIQPHLAAWRYYAYGQANKGLAEIEPPRNPELRSHFVMAKTLSSAFEAWDKFDHSEANRLLSLYKSEVGARYADYFIQLKALTAKDENKSRQKTPALIYDLWLNAHRRAVQGRYDDAVARVYRMTEQIAQWALKYYCDVDTADIPENFIPEDLNLIKNHKGRYQAALYYSWELVGRKVAGPLGQFINAHHEGLLKILEARNSSILAHGDTPVGEGVWQEVRLWIEETLMPYFLKELKKLGLKKMPPQLPDKYEWL
ncbi:MAG: TIGR02710 family CRISPR-associated CARF protein [Desulfobacterales bacterium]